MNVMGALVVTKKNPKMLGKPIDTCVTCKHCSQDFIIVEPKDEDNDTTKVRHISGEYIRCHKIKEQMEFENKSNNPARVHRDFGHICPYISKYE